jgi:rhamnogalacturonyl hydrolase YesR
MRVNKAFDKTAGTGYLLRWETLTANRDTLRSGPLPPPGMLKLYKLTKNFPSGSTPEEIGQRLSKRFVPAAHFFPDRMVYPEVCAWLGALRFADETGDKQLVKQLQDRFEPLFSSESSMLPKPDHVDNNMFGCLPLEFYRITKDRRYLDLGLRYADTQWELPPDATVEQKALADKGLTWQTRMWIDDMYMITIVQTQAYILTGDRKYLDRTAREMVVYLDSLQRPNGLFYHAPDVPFFWGRGNGWMAAGMTELLKVLPDSHPCYKRIFEGYRTMMRSLKDCQQPSGMWNQLLDAPDCWAETSGTGMFTYAMITGIKHGWLPVSEYEQVVQKAWLKLVSYINADGDMTEVCEGTNKKNDRQYYYDRKRNTGDFHGQAPALWSTFALIEK